MTDEKQQRYNEWYWKSLTTPALERLIKQCKKENRFLNLKVTKEDFKKVLKYLKEWEGKQVQLEENTKKDLWLVRNFKGYEAFIEVR